jgi:hypothetical protein
VFDPEALSENKSVNKEDHCKEGGLTEIFQVVEKTVDSRIELLVISFDHLGLSRFLQPVRFIW